MVDSNIGNEVVTQGGDHNGVTDSTPATQAELESAPHSLKTAPKPSPFSKPCSLCQCHRDVLIRCQIDESRKWNFVCPGKCWKAVSGGSVDGDGEYPWYKYGGTWKNKHEYVSGKIKGKAREKSKELHNGHKGPHRSSGHWTPKAKKNDGLVKIGADDGGSDIEVSEVDDDDDDIEEWGGCE